MNLIKLKHGEMVKLAETFKVSPRTVRNALCGESKSSLARMLRKAALERGAYSYEVIRDGMPSCQTQFETSENKMVQTFGKRVRIVADLSTGDAAIYRDSHIESTYQNITMRELSKVQNRAKVLAEELV